MRLLEIILITISSISLIMLLSTGGEYLFSKITEEGYFKTTLKYKRWGLAFLASTGIYFSLFFWQKASFRSSLLSLFLSLPFIFELYKHYFMTNLQLIKDFLFFIENKDVNDGYSFLVSLQNPWVKILSYSLYFSIVVALYLNDSNYGFIPFVILILSLPFLKSFFGKKFLDYHRYKMFLKNPSRQIIDEMRPFSGLPLFVKLDLLPLMSIHHPQNTLAFIKSLTSSEKNEKQDGLIYYKMKIYFDQSEYNRVLKNYKRMENPKRFYDREGFLSMVVESFIKTGQFYQATLMLNIALVQFPHDSKLLGFRDIIKNSQEDMVGGAILAPIDIFSFHREDYVVEDEDYKRNNKKDLRYNKKYKMTILNLFSNKCAKCGSDQDLHMDHFFISKSEGGNFCMRHKSGIKINNMIPLCSGCNIQKSNNSFKDFFTKEDLSHILSNQESINKKINLD